MNKLQLSFAIAAITVPATLLGQTQTFTGVLLDANCSELRNVSGTAATRGAAAEGGIQDSSGIARPGAPGPGGAAGDPIAATDPTKAEQTASRERAGSGTLPPVQFRNCSPSSTTSSYALYSEGRIIHLDSESNSRIRQHLRSENQTADPAQVQVQGQLRLKVTSVQPMRAASRNP